MGIEKFGSMFLYLLILGVFRLASSIRGCSTMASKCDVDYFGALSLVRYRFVVMYGWFEKFDEYEIPN